MQATVQYTVRTISSYLMQEVPWGFDLFAYSAIKYKLYVNEQRLKEQLQLY